MYPLRCVGCWLLVTLAAVCTLGVQGSTAQEASVRVLFSGPASATDDLAFTADGKTLVLVSRSGTLKLWDMALHKERVAFNPARSGGALAVAPDGVTLAWTDGKGHVNLWEAVTGKHRATLKGHTDRVRSVAFSGDGKMLASCANDSTARLWDLATANEVRLLKHEREVGSVVFMPDGKTLATGDETGVHFWDLTTGKLLRTFDVPARRLVVTKDGKTFATACESDLSIWDVESGKVQARMTHKGRTYTIAFSPDGRTLATGSWHSAVKLWDVPSGEERATLAHEWPVHALTFSPDGKLLATATRNRWAENPDEGDVKLWELAPTKERPAKK